MKQYIPWQWTRAQNELEYPQILFSRICFQFQWSLWWVSFLFSRVMDVLGYILTHSAIKGLCLMLNKSLCYGRFLQQFIGTHINRNAAHWSDVWSPIDESFFFKREQKLCSNLLIKEKFLHKKYQNLQTELLSGHYLSQLLSTRGNRWVFFSSFALEWTNVMLLNCHCSWGARALGWPQFSSARICGLYER